MEMNEWASLLTQKELYYLELLIPIHLRGGLLISSPVAQSCYDWGKVMSVKKKKKKSSSPDNHFRIKMTFLRPHSLGMLSLFTIKVKKLFWYFMTSAKFFPLQARSQEQLQTGHLGFCSGLPRQDQADCPLPKILKKNLSSSPIAPQEVLEQGKTAVQQDPRKLFMGQTLLVQWLFAYQVFGAFKNTRTH